VERIESKLEQSYGVNVTVVTSTRLQGVEQFDDAWCKKLDEEMGHYFAVQRRYQSLLKEAERNSADAEQLLIEAGVLLQKAAADMTLPLVKEDLGKQVAQHTAMIGLTARLARDRADYIDQPAPAWQAKDLDGKLLTLRDYKGKVVLLHFWRRADGWSLRVLPQVEQLAEQFADQPVVVLGMNTDKKDEDASFVTDKMGLAFPIVRADKFADKYNATGSVLFVIDQKGIVRDIYMGYSPTLREDAASVVTGLLSDGEK
ncbi:MAG: peroxiredoxin family protein, partial [Pirellulales bacterium]